MTAFDVLLYDDVGMRFDDRIVATEALGGSEFVLWQLAREMAKRGLRVLVWQGAGPSAPDRVESGATYRFGASANPVHARSVIHHRHSSRAYERVVTFDARIALCSDVWGPHYERALPALAPRLDAVVCVSDWQASRFPGAARPRVIPNPLPIEAYEFSPVARNPRVFVYASAAVKGLLPTLATWAAWRTEHEAVRAATLRVLNPGYDDPGVAASAAGVELVGAVPFHRVLGELRSAAGLFYVNDFPETFCLVAALAEACGARTHVWTRRGGAVAEVVESSLVTTDGRVFEAAFLRHLSAPAGAGCARPRDFRVDHVVDRWMKLLDSLA